MLHWFLSRDYNHPTKQIFCLHSIEGSYTHSYSVFVLLLEFNYYDLDGIARDHQEADENQ